MKIDISSNILFIPKIFAFCTRMLHIKENKKKRTLENHPRIDCSRSTFYGLCFYGLRKLFVSSCVDSLSIQKPLEV